VAGGVLLREAAHAGGPTSSRVWVYVQHAVPGIAPTTARSRVVRRELSPAVLHAISREALRNLSQTGVRRME